MSPITQNQTILTVSQLNNSARHLLERQFAGIWLTGEISNFVKPASGHWYFTLKDDGAQVRGAMFRGNNRNSSIKPVDGMQVLVHARVSLYEPRGDYQIIVEQMQNAGDGLLKQQYEQLKNRLAAEGLFAQHHKKPLPKQINRVGIITSATGAAVRDIISVLHRRAPQLEVIIYPSAVQGQGAAEQLAYMLQVAEQRNEVDVLILGRGGGSLEDLWCFNEPTLAYAIYQCALPIVSAVGHEVDVTISDFVADVRAATPSAAAELISPDSDALHSQIRFYHSALSQAMAGYLNYNRQQAQLLEQQLSHLHPQNVLNQHNQKIDEWQLRLNNALTQSLNAKQQQQAHLQHRFKLAQSEFNLPHKRSVSENLSARLQQLMAQKLQQHNNQLQSLSSSLDIVSPLATLSRGYSITLTQQHKIIRQTQDVNSGDLIETRLKDGTIKSRVE